MLNQPGPIFSCQFVFLFFLQHTYRQMIRKVNEKNIESYFLSKWMVFLGAAAAQFVITPPLSSWKYLTSILYNNNTPLSICTPIIKYNQR